MTDDEIRDLVYAMAERWHCASSCAPTEFAGQFAIEVGNEVRERCAKLADSCAAEGSPMLHNLAACIRGA